MSEPLRIDLIVRPGPSPDPPASLAAVAGLLGRHRGLRIEARSDELRLSIATDQIEALGPLVEAAAEAHGCVLRLPALDADVKANPLDGRPAGIWAAIGDAVLAIDLAHERGENQPFDLFGLVKVETPDGHRVAVDGRPPRVDAVGPWPADIGAVKYDDMSYHLGGADEAGQPHEHGFTHIGFYLVWLIRHDLHDKQIIREGTARDVKLGKLDAGDLIDETDGKLSSDLLVGEGVDFSDARYEAYLAEYERLFAAEPDYSVAGNAANYALVEPLIDELYARWVADGCPRPTAGR